MARYAIVVALGFLTLATVTLGFTEVAKPEDSGQNILLPDAADDFHLLNVDTKMQLHPMQ